MRDTGGDGFPGEVKDDDEIEELDPREAQRTRRRDHDLDAEGRALLRPGMGKVFKQILDHQAKEADALAGRAAEAEATPKPGKRRR